jgi:hypothetical protein
MKHIKMKKITRKVEQVKTKLLKAKDINGKRQFAGHEGRTYLRSDVAKGIVGMECYQGHTEIPFAETKAYIGIGSTTPLGDWKVIAINFVNKKTGERKKVSVIMPTSCEAGTSCSV